MRVSRRSQSGRLRYPRTSTHDDESRTQDSAGRAAPANTAPEVERAWECDARVDKPRCLRQLAARAPRPVPRRAARSRARAFAPRCLRGWPPAAAHTDRSRTPRRPMRGRARRRCKPRDDGPVAGSHWVRSFPQSSSSRAQPAQTVVAVLPRRSNSLTRASRLESASRWFGFSARDASNLKSTPA